MVALLGLHTTQKEFFACLGACNSLKQETCVTLLSEENTPLLIKSAILQISVCLYDMPVPAIMNTMLLDMNNIQTQLSVRTHNNSNVISRIPLGVKIPKGLQNSESPLSSMKINGSTELSFCRSSCAEHLFEGILGTLTRILRSMFPCITDASIAGEFIRIKKSSKSWQLLEKEKMNKNRINKQNNKNNNSSNNSGNDNNNDDNDDDDYNNDDNDNDNESDISEYKHDDDDDNNNLSYGGRLDKRALSVTMSGKSSRSRKSSYSADGESGVGGTMGGSLRNNSSQISEKSGSKKRIKNSKNKRNKNDNDENKNDINEIQGADNKISGKVSFNRKDKNDKKKSSVNKKSKIPILPETEADHKDDNMNSMSMENRIQLVESVIILFDTLMTENGNLFHCNSYSSIYSLPGNFNSYQCGKLLNLCISANLMMKIPKNKFLMPERAEKVGEILKLLIQHLYELKLRYLLLEDDMNCISILCKSVLKISISNVMSNRLTTVDNLEKNEIIDHHLHNNNDNNNNNNNNNNNKISSFRNHYDNNGNYNNKNNFNIKTKNEIKEENIIRIFMNSLGNKKNVLSPNNDVECFTNNLDLRPFMSYEKLQKTALYTVFKEYLISTIEYLENGGPLLMDVDGNAIRDMSVSKINGNATLLKLSAFQLWLNGGARYLSTALGIIATHSFDHSTDSNSNNNNNNHDSKNSKNDKSNNNHDNNNNNNDNNIDNNHNNGNKNNSIRNDVANTIFHIFILLLKNDVENIRNNTKHIKSRSIKVRIELERVQRSQNALHMLGASSVVQRLIGYSYRLSKSESLSSSIVPLALKLGAALTLRNKATQNSFINDYKFSLLPSIGPKDNSNVQISLSVTAMQRILKIMRSHIDTVRTHGSRSLSSSCLKISLQLFNFCGSMCSDHNGNARHFFRDQHYSQDYRNDDDRNGNEIENNYRSKKGNGGNGGGVRRVNCDIVKELASLVNSLLLSASTMMRYINNSYFNEYVAPNIWNPLPNSGKRRFIAWHDQNIDYYSLSQLIYTASMGFVSLTELSQGPCVENQKSVLGALNKCPALLEFLGTF